MTGRGRLRTVLLVGLLAAGAALVSPAPAAFGSCAGADSMVGVTNAAEVVITGTLVDIDDPGGNVSPHEVTWMIDVSRVHKGRAKTTTFATGIPYSVNPVIGDSYVFLLTTSDGHLQAGACYGVLEVGTEQATEVRDLLGPGLTPDEVLDGPAREGRPGARDAWNVARWMGGLLVLGGLAAGGLVLRRRIRPEARSSRNGTDGRGV